MITTEEKPKMIDTSEALKFVEKHGPKPISLPTIIKWCEQYNLGVKIGGRWYVYEDKLRNFLDKEGKNEKKT